MRLRVFAAALVLTLATVSCGNGATSSPPRTTPQSAKTSFPVIEGWAHGRMVRYLLQEVSDPAVAKLMKERTGFDGQTVPELADVPAKALANRYLFMNGVAGPNPVRFARNGIDRAPGEPGDRQSVV